MKICFAFLTMLFYSFTTYSQDKIRDFKFVGYDGDNPVFAMIKSAGENEIDIAQEEQEVVSDEALMEEEMAADEAVMEEAEASSGLQLILLNESTGKMEILPVPYEITDVLSYADGNLVGISEYGLELVLDDSFTDFDFQEDWSDEGDFREQVLEYAEKFNIVNMTFSPDGTKLHYPVYNRLQIRSYDIKSGTFSDKDFSHIDEYGGSLLAPVETANTLYFLAQLQGTFDLFKMTKGSQELIQFPFYFGRRGSFGLKFHPTKEQLLFLYEDTPFAYDYGLNKYQPLTIPEIPVARADKIGSDFEKIYYSHHHNEWRYGILVEEQLMSKSLNINEVSSTYVLDSAGVEKVIAEEKMKNRSPKEELGALFKKLKQIPQPFSKELKSKVNDIFMDFEQKYASRADEPEVRNILLTTKILRLDTAYVTEDIVEENKHLLIKMVRDENINYDKLIGFQLMGRVATIQPPVHPARVAVLQALVDDYLEENEMTYETLEPSGIQLLLIALKANGKYEEAIKYNQILLDHTPDHSLIAKQKIRIEMIQLQLSAGQYRDALATIAHYKDGLEKDDGSYREKQIKADIYQAHAYAGMKDFDKAIETLDAQQNMFKEKEDEIFGSNTKSWVRFSLRYAYADIHFQKGTKEKEAHLKELLEFVSESKDDFLYGSMYADTLDLLDEIGQPDKAALLPQP